MRFPAGLLRNVVAKAKKRGIELQIIDKRPEPAPVLPLPKSCSHFYDFQQEAIEAALKYKRGIIQIATSGGKTETAIGLALRVNMPSLFLVDEKGLVRQAMKRWQKITGKHAGIIAEGKVDPRYFTVATLQTLKQRLKTCHPEVVSYVKHSVGCVIFDEAHILGAKSYFKTAVSIPNAAYRIGLSATPIGRSDKMDAYVIGATGKPIYKMSISALVARGKAAKATVIFYRYPGAKSLRMGARPFHKLYRAGIVDEEARNRAILRICMITPKPILIFFERQVHGYKLLNMIQQLGLKVRLVQGSSSGKERMQLAHQLDRGKIDVLLCSKVFNKGTNIPGVRSGINAAGYKAVITATQKLGRTMRITDFKTRFWFWDLVDAHHDTLLRHSQERARVYKREGLDFHTVSKLQDAIQLFDAKVEPVMSTPEGEATRASSESIAVVTAPPVYTLAPRMAFCEKGIIS